MRMRPDAAPLLTLTELDDGPSLNISGSATVESLVALLMREGRCDAKSIERCRRVAEESGQRLDAVLSQLGLVTERDLATGYAQLLGLSIVTPDDYPAERLWADHLSLAFLRDARALPLAEDADGLVLGMADPLDLFTAEAVATATRRKIRRRVCVPIELEAAFGRLYSDRRAEGEEVVESSAAAIEEDAERLRDLASDAPVIRLVNQIIARAVETQASDIHIEPFEARLRLRYRYDGVLHEVEAPPPQLTAAIISRVKIMAHFDIAERRLPQDGRIRLVVRGQEVDFRVSTVASIHGESVVLRVLDRSAVEFDYARLGLSPAVADNFRTTLELPNGIALVTAPTGSGKITTLYTGLLGLNSVSRKVLTIEDPVEYQLTGINQLQVKPQIGLNFAALLRSILRQDPDVIMVGEIRDIETAQIAVQAALTGHLVLSTVHTNSAAATVTRLRDMGLEDYLMTAVLRGVLAQRLVRRLCFACRRPAPAPAELIARYSLDRRGVAGPAMLGHPVGCPQCRQTGYRGRQAIAEFLRPNDAIERLIFSRAEHSEIERAAVADGMRTMFDAGLDAALTGDTTIQEVVRSIRSDT
jgi:general secretion pathway protein E